jgi:predicted Fe-S protein YdhL (DUF1289 family)
VRCNRYNSIHQEAVIKAGMTPRHGPFEVMEPQARVRRERRGALANTNRANTPRSEDNDRRELKDPPRDFDCPNYNTCLCLAAALNWHSFSCQGCTRSIDEHLIWRAHQELRKDKALSKLLQLPRLETIQGADHPAEPALPESPASGREETKAGASS